MMLPRLPSRSHGAIRSPPLRVEASPTTLTRPGTLEQSSRDRIAPGLMAGAEVESEHPETHRAGGRPQWTVCRRIHDRCRRAVDQRVRRVDVAADPRPDRNACADPNRYAARNQRTDSNGYAGAEPDPVRGPRHLERAGCLAARTLHRGRPLPTAAHVHGAGRLGGQYRWPVPRPAGAGRRSGRAGLLGRHQAVRRSLSHGQRIPEPTAGIIGGRPRHGAGEAARPHRHDTTAVTLGGYQGKQLTLTAPASATGCSDGDYSVWQLPLGAINALTPGELDRVWVLDVAGQRLVIDAAETPDQTTADIAEVQGVLDFLQLAPGH